MKRPIWLLIITGLTFGAGLLGVVNFQAARHARQLEQERNAWLQEKAALEAALEEAQLQAQVQPVSTPLLVTNSAQASTASARLAPAEILARLQGLRSPGVIRMREAVYWLEELVQTGPSAVPAIRDFLALNSDIEFDPSSLPNRSRRDGRLPGNFTLPPSLRLGLFEVLQRIGGDEAEALLAQTLARATTGLEVACLTRALHELAPDKYRESALSVARGLLAGISADNPASALFRNHRDYLFDVLSFYGDSTFALQAQGQLLGANNQIDRGALRYLERTIGAQAVPMVEQVYQNPMLLTNAAAKEPLARLALNFVGADARANEFYQKAINDPVLSRGHRRNLIEDLNEDGFADPRNLTAKDLALIQNRIALIEQLAPKAMDQVNAEAFQEAYKDLVNMRARAVRGNSR